MGKKQAQIQGSIKAEGWLIAKINGLPFGIRSRLVKYIFRKKIFKASAAIGRTKL